MLIRKISKKHAPSLNYFFSNIIDLAGKCNMASTAEGQSKNLIFLHGFLGNQSNFFYLRHNSYLQNACNIHFLDFRNHGESPHSDYSSIPDLAGDVSHYISKNNLTNVILVGHSMGGKVAMCLGEKNPESIIGICVVDMANVDYTNKDIFPSNVRSGIMVKELVTIDFKDKSYNQIRDAIKNIAQDPILTGFFLKNVKNYQTSTGETYKWIPNMNILSRSYEIISSYQAIGKFEKNFVIIKGKKSNYIPNHVISQYLKIFPHFTFDKLVEVEDAGHWVHFDKPYEFANLVSNFCQQTWKKQM